MDKTLLELKRNREDTEKRFREILEGMEAELGTIQSELESIRRSSQKSESGIEGVFSVLTETLRIQLRHVEGLRELMTLHNARCAELARQLTVLPLERMDLILDRFERRLEAQECELQRIKKGESKGAK